MYEIKSKVIPKGNPAKEDKKMFKDAVDTFQKSVIEFKNIGNDITYIKTEMRDIKTDIESIKSKV